MTRQHSINFGSSVCIVAVLLAAGTCLSSVSANAEQPIPFDAIMHSVSVKSAVPPRPDANSASGGQVDRGHVTNAGKAEIGAGFLLIGAGVIAISITAILQNGGFKPSGAKTPALYAGGAGAAAVGVTLVAFVFHKRSAK